MTKHLPECLHDDDTYGLRGLCICDELRACQQRVLNAAREAVLSAKVIGNAVYVEDEATHFTWKREALAAIDRLKEKP